MYYKLQHKQKIGKNIYKMYRQKQNTHTQLVDSAKLREGRFEEWQFSTFWDGQSHEARFPPCWSWRSRFRELIPTCVFSCWRPVSTANESNLKQWISFQIISSCNNKAICCSSMFNSHLVLIHVFNIKRWFQVTTSQTLRHFIRP